MTDLRRYYCPQCGSSIPGRDRFCIQCGAPQPKRHPVANFFLALLYAAAIYGVFFGMQNLITLFYGFMIIADLAPMNLADNVYESLYWQNFSANFALVSILGVLLTILIYFFVYTLRRRSFRREIELRPISPRPIAGILVTGAAANIVVAVIIALLSVLFPFVAEAGTENSEVLEQLFSGGNRVFEILYVALFVPILEEIVFRGLIYTRLRRAMPLLAAQILSAVIFGAAHGNLLQFFYAGLAGFLMVLIFEHYHSILASIAFHLAFNGCSYALQMVTDDLLFFALFFISIGVLLFSFYLIFGKNDRSTPTPTERTSHEAL